ncbi:DUF1571 domain-containing protein [bacterium]|nr:DUF1571 domain-containing protein [bacterium]
MHTLALVASLSLTPGCAKLHHKLHKHKHANEEMAYVPFPAKSSHTGLASVSPQMPTMVNSTVSKQEPVAFSAAPGVVVQPPLTAPQSPARSELRTSPFATGPSSNDDSKAAQVPAPVTITPSTPPLAAPSVSKPAASPPVQAESRPPATEASKPSTPAADSVITPSIEPKLPSTPPELPSTDKLPIDLPKDLPPPPASPNLSNRTESEGTGSSGNATIAVAANPPSASPFATSAENSKTQSDTVITLSQPGIAIEPGPDAKTAPADAKSAAPGVTNAAQSEASELASILEKTRRTFAETSNYKVEVALQERMNGRLLPQDKFTLYKRRQPLAVRMEWIEGKDVGREVIYSPAETKGMIQIRMPKGLIPRISMAPDSPLVRSKSRHPIDEAGADSVVDRLTATLRKFESGSPEAGSLNVESVVDPQLGPIRRVSHHTIEREIWVVDLDENTGLPLTIHATDESGELLEHYEFRGYQLNLSELLTAEAFDHNARWGNTKLFGRLASGNSKEESTKR